MHVVHVHVVYVIHIYAYMNANQELNWNLAYLLELRLCLAPAGAGNSPTTGLAGDRPAVPTPTCATKG